MTVPRRETVKENVEGTYHIVSRCVRQAFLCGLDARTGGDDQVVVGEGGVVLLQPDLVLIGFDQLDLREDEPDVGREEPLSRFHDLFPLLVDPEGDEEPGIRRGLQKRGRHPNRERG